MAAYHQETTASRQRLVAADTLIKTQYEARLRAEAEVMILSEKRQQRQPDHLSRFKQQASLNAQLTRTIDVLSVSRDILSAHLDSG